MGSHEKGLNVNMFSKQCIHHLMVFPKTNQNVMAAKKLCTLYIERFILYKICYNILNTIFIRKSEIISDQRIMHIFLASIKQATKLKMTEGSFMILPKMVLEYAR